MGGIPQGAVRAVTTWTANSFNPPASRPHVLHVCVTMHFFMSPVVGLAVCLNMWLY
jgi:hypothetical protein